MKVLRQIAHGDAMTALCLADEPPPQPGPGEIVVAMEAAPLHRSELFSLTDAKRTPPASLPRTCGVEGVGRVTAVGRDVHGFEIGQRVFPPKYSGLFSEQLCCRADMAYLAPDDCAADSLAIVHTMGLTAYLLLEDYAKLPPGSWIVHDAANSSIGRIIIGMAHAQGLRTVNIVRRAGLDDELKSLGADAVIVDPGDPESLAREVATATGGAAIQVALDMIGGAAARRLLFCLSAGGRLVLYGGTSREPVPVDFNDVMNRDITIAGMGMSRSFNKRDSAGKQAVMAALGRMAANGVFKTKIAGRYKLADYRSAFAHLARENAHRDGKIVMTF